MVRKAGFTLIEVLVALAIVSIALTAALRATSVATGGATDFRERLLAAWVAENRLAEYSFGLWPDLGERDGTAEQGNMTFVWHERVSATVNPLFRKVELRVFAANAPDHALAQLVGYASRTP